MAPIEMANQSETKNNSGNFDPLRSSLVAQDDLASELDNLNDKIAGRDMDLVRLKEEKDGRFRLNPRRSRNFVAILAKE